MSDRVSTALMRELHDQGYVFLRQRQRIANYRTFYFDNLDAGFTDPNTSGTFQLHGASEQRRSTLLNAIDNNQILLVGTSVFFPGSTIAAIQGVSGDQWQTGRGSGYNNEFQPVAAAEDLYAVYSNAALTKFNISLIEESVI